jgi:hypothetical protein
MLPRLCSRLSLRVTVVKLDTCLTFTNRGRRGFTNPAEHKSYILTYARQNSEPYEQARFCSYSSTIIGLVLRLTACIYSVGGARLHCCILSDGFTIMEPLFISASRF